jgi:hypothetical protein
MGLNEAISGGAYINTSIRMQFFFRYIATSKPFMGIALSGDIMRGNAQVDLIL